jgi:hypothetical protein
MAKSTLYSKFHITRMIKKSTSVFDDHYLRNMQNMKCHVTHFLGVYMEQKRKLV